MTTQFPSSRFLKRFHREIDLANQNFEKDDSIYLSFSESNFQLLHAIVKAPKSYPYNSISFHLSILLDPNFPFAPPLIKVNDPNTFFHPNICDIDGTVCLEILNSSCWAPSTSIYSIIQEFVSILLFPETGSTPLNLLAAELYHKSPQLWKQVLSKRMSQFPNSKDPSTNHIIKKHFTPSTTWIRQKRERPQEFSSDVEETRETHPSIVRIKKKSSSLSEPFEMIDSLLDFEDISTSTSSFFIGEEEEQ